MAEAYDVWIPGAPSSRTTPSTTRWWERTEFEEVLAGLGFVEVRSLGDDAGWVAVARRPG